MHLQQGDDALAPASTHPELGVSRSRTLDQCIQGLAGVRAPELLPVPGITSITYAAQRLLAFAWTSTFSPFAAWGPMIEMATGTVIEREVTLVARRLFTSLRELRYKWQLAVVALVECARF